MEDQLICVDIFDNEIGSAPKLEAHQKCLLHRAFSVFLVNQGKMLIQRRAAHKYHSGGKWANAEYDALLTDGNASTDAEARMQMMADAENILIEEGVIVPLQVREKAYAYAEGFTNFVRYYMGGELDLTYAY